MKRLALLLLPAWVLAQGPARLVYVSAPKPRVISGEQIRLSALARDQNGAARTGDAFQWRSSNNNIATVDGNGMVTARGLGLVDLFATTAGVTGQVRIQVLPLRIDVFPGAAQVFVGERVPYTAVALDVNENPLPGVTFQWQLSGANGNFTQAATITGNGVLSARAVARVTVRAVIPYGGVLSQFLPSSVGYARLEIKPRNDFRLTRLLSTTDMRHSFQLRPIAGRQLAANDLGQVALVASLDGLVTALLLWENGRFDILAAGGTPGPVSPSLLMDFSNPALNNRGQALVRASAQGAGGLLLASRAGAQYLAVDGEAAAGVEGLGGFTTTPYSLNDNGDAVFFGSFRLPATTQNRNGLFRLPAGGAPQRIATSGDDFSSLGAANISNSEFGIDRSGAIYFVAFSGQRRAIYRQERFGAPTRLIGTGDALAGSTIRNLGTPAVGQDGDLAFYYFLESNAQGVARLSGNRLRFAPLRSNVGVLALHSQGGVVYYADGPRGWGLYRWNDGDTPTPVLLQGRLAPNDEPVQQFYTAAVNARGEVVAGLRTAQTDFVVTRPGAASPVLFRSGAVLQATANIQIFNGSLVKGDGSGPPYVLLGAPASLFQLDNNGLIPRLVIGDRFPGGETFDSIRAPLESSNGELYFDNTRRLTSTGVDLLPLGAFRADDGTTVNRGLVRAVNARGGLIWEAGTNRSHTRVYLHQDGRDTFLISYSGETRYQSPSPAGGTVNSRGDLALDDRGRALVQFRVTGGPSGLFLWENGRWRATALFNATQLRGQVVTNAFNLRAVGDRFFAVFSLRQGSALAEWRDNEWTWIIGFNDDAPNGNVINGVGPYDVNRRGDIAVALNSGPIQMLALRSDAGTKLVQLNIDAPEELDFFSVQQIELREDGRIYFGGLNLLDESVLYLAEPLRTNWPSRSRSPAESGAGFSPRGPSGPLLLPPDQPWSIDLTSPQPFVLSGRVLQLEARVTSAEGAPIPDAALEWRSSNPLVAEVDAGGRVRGLTPGQAVIEAASGQASARLTLQVQPARIRIEPPELNLEAGQQVRLTAQALDASGAAIAGVPFLWTSGTPGVASVDGAGTVTALADGLVTVTALVDLPGPGFGFSALARVRVRPRSPFRVNRLVASDSLTRPVTLRRIESQAAAGDSTVFTAALSNGAYALLLLDNRGLRPLAVSGDFFEPTGQVITTFGGVTINASGDVVAAVNFATWPNWRLIRYPAAGGQEPLDLPSEYLGSGNLSSRSLGPAGELMFFTWNNRGQNVLYRRPDGRFERVLTQGDQVPGFGAVNWMGDLAAPINGKSVLLTNGPNGNGLLEWDGRAVRKLVATGDALLGRAVQWMDSAILTPTGDVYLRIGGDGFSQIVRYSGGQWSNVVQGGQPVATGVTVHWIDSLRDVRGSSVVFSGGSDRGGGLFRFDGTNFELLARYGEGNDEFRWFEFAGGPFLRGPSGNLPTRLVRTSAAGFAPVLETGRPLDLAAGASLNWYELIGGANAASPVFLSSSRGLVRPASGRFDPVLLHGDPLPDGQTVFWTSAFAANRNGDIAFRAGSQRGEALYLWRNGRVTRLIQNWNETRVAGGLLRWIGWAMSVNTAGQVVVDAGYDGGYGLFLFAEGAAPRTIATAGSPAPGGGTFRNFQQAAIDERGRVAFFGDLGTGPAPLFYWENGQVRRIRQIGESGVTSFDGRLQAAADRIYLFQRLSNTQEISAWNGASWTTVVDQSSYGICSNWFSPASNGDLLYLACLPEGVNGLLLRKPDGRSTLVAGTGQRTADGEWLLNLLHWTLSEQGDVFFAAVSPAGTKDRIGLFQAAPR
jgi:hypothetical protein